MTSLAQTLEALTAKDSPFVPSRFEHLVGVLRRMADHIEEGKPSVLPLAEALVSYRYIQLTLPTHADPRLGYAVLRDDTATAAILAERAASGDGVAAAEASWPAGVAESGDVVMVDADGRTVWAKPPV